MTLSSYKDLKNLETIKEIDQEIFLAQKTLFEYKLKKISTQGIKPHVFKHTRRRLAQLKFKKSCLLKNN